MDCSAFTAILPRLVRLVGYACWSIMLLHGESSSSTRWSALQLVPDADMLAGGDFVVNAQGFYFNDVSEHHVVRPVGTVNFGVIEWVNMEAGYSGGFTLGLKARVLGETKPWMPSLAIGVRNMFSHREAYLFDRLDDSLGSELYLTLGKAVEPVKMRFSAGVQTIPGNRRELFNPFVAIEKYFGAGLYMTAEVHRRDRNIHPSLFASWRFWKKRVEISSGVIDISGLFDDGDVPEGTPFYSSPDSRFVRPGIWFGLRFRGTMKFGKSEGLTGLENRLYDQSASIDELRNRIDSLRQILYSSSARITDLDKSVNRITDSSLTNEERLRELAIDRLSVLGTLYDAEPFEPDHVNRAMSELVGHRDRILPALYAIISDPVQKTKIRTLSVAALGEIGTQGAADLVIEILGRKPGPEITIESLIALGKMKETRAVYLIQQLCNDPHDDVAFTAAEVLQKLEKETGISVSPVPAAKLLPSSIPEKRIGSPEPYEPEEKTMKKRERGAGTKDPEKPAQESRDLRKIETPEIAETTVSEEEKRSSDPDPAVSSAEAGEPVRIPAEKAGGKDSESTRSAVMVGSGPSVSGEARGGRPDQGSGNLRTPGRVEGSRSVNESKNEASKSGAKPPRNEQSGSVEGTW